MTITAKALKHQPSVLVYHDTFFDPRTPDVEPIKGYRLVVGTESVFLPESEADNIARYMLFTEPVKEIENPFAPAYSEPDKE